MNNKSNRRAANWTRLVSGRPVTSFEQEKNHVLGVLHGEGIGSEVIGAALNVLRAVESISESRFDLRFGDQNGNEPNTSDASCLTESVVSFCRDVFAARGALLRGPNGGRFVYDIRKHFDLFCKLSPLRVSPALVGSTRLKSESIRDVDILLVRENVAGVYQGRWSNTTRSTDGRGAEQSFSYSEWEVRRILDVASRLAGHRRGKITVVLKDGGIPLISELWRDCAAEIAHDAGLSVSFMNVDLAAYSLVQHPGGFDVLVCPNLFGDILADLGAVLLGSRGNSFSGNFSATGAATYQTNHGAANDLAGRNEANPVGQIFSLALLLRESFSLTREANLIEDAVAQVWRDGWRTFDLMQNGMHLVGTKEMGDRIADTCVRLASQAA